MARTAKSVADVKKRRDWLVSRVPPNGCAKREELISATCYEHSIPWEVGEDDLRIMMGLKKLVILKTDQYFTLVKQVWRPGPALEEAIKKQVENERKALEIFTAASDPQSGLVERNAFHTALLTTKLTNGEAYGITRTLFRKGYIYETKLGFLKRLPTETPR